MRTIARSAVDAWDRFALSDPALVRLTMALRASAAMIAALAASVLLVHLALTAALLATAVAMLASIAPNDPGERERRATTLLMALPAALCVAAAALAQPSATLSDGLFLLVIFAAVYAGRFGPRGNAFGNIGAIAYFFALFLHASAAALPALLAAVAIGTACAFAARLVLLPERPRATLARLLRSFETSERVIARLSLRVLHEPAARNPRSARQLHVDTIRLNELALAIEHQLAARDAARWALDAASARTAIFDAELAADHLTAFALRVCEGGTSPSDAQLRVALRAVARAVRATRELLVCLEQPAAQPPAAAQDSEPLPQPAPVASWRPHWADPWTRQGVQVTIASALAMLAGALLSSQRWYWAVLAAFIVFNNTSSRGETVARAWLRILGTAIGVIFGIVLAQAVAGHGWIELTSIFLSLFLGVYFLRVSYALMMFFLTAALALLYARLGMFSDDLLYIRLAETAIGAFLGGLAAIAVLPIPTGEVVNAKMLEVVDALERVVRESTERLTGGESRPQTLRAARDLDARVQELVLRVGAVAPLSNRTASAKRMRERLRALDSAAYHARTLARIADSQPGSLAGDGATLAQSAAALALESLQRCRERFRGAGGPASAITSTAQRLPKAPALRELTLVGRALTHAW